MNNLKNIGLSFAVISALSLGLTGCGSSDTAATTTSSGQDVEVERGPVLMATVKDADGQIATYADAMKPVYHFRNKITYPVTVTGGYIDVNQDGKLDGNDTALDKNITMKSFSNVVTPITTMASAGLADGNTTGFEKKIQELADSFGVSVTELKKRPSKANTIKVALLANIIYGKQVGGKAIADINATDVNSSLSDYNTSDITDFDKKSLSEKVIALEEAKMKTLVDSHKISMLDESAITKAEYKSKINLGSTVLTFEQGKYSATSKVTLSSDLNITKYELKDTKYLDATSDFNLTAGNLEFYLNTSNANKAGYYNQNITFTIDGNQTIDMTLPIYVTAISGYTDTIIGLDSGQNITFKSNGITKIEESGKSYSGIHTIDGKTITTTIDKNGTKITYVMPDRLEYGEKVSVNDTNKTITSLSSLSSSSSTFDKLSYLNGTYRFVGADKNETFTFYDNNKTWTRTYEKVNIVAL
jgi:hypothetical protein